MSQYVPNSSTLAQNNGGIGALGDLTFVTEVIIVERSNTREFLTLRGESLGIVFRPFHRSLSSQTKEFFHATFQGQKQENDLEKHQ